MPLTGFDNSARWNQFKEVQQRPAGVQEDAFIRARFNYEFTPRRRRVVSADVAITVDSDASWVLQGQKTAKLLEHEQGHYDITALGAREVYNGILALTGRNLNQQARQLRQRIQRRINAANRRYDAQTNHGADAAEQQRWERRIRTAKGSTGGELADLPR